jgi:integrase
MKIQLENGSGTIDLKYLVKDFDGKKNPRIYFRRKGQKKIRLRSTPGTQNFLKEYDEAYSGIVRSNGPKRRHAEGSLKWLCQQYFGSPEFMELHDTTRRVRRGILDNICQIVGALPYGQMEPRHVRKIRNQFSEKREAANSRVKALRQLFRWAVVAELAAHNPTETVPYLPRKNKDGHHTWTREEIERYVLIHPIGTKAFLAFALLFYTGVRISDAAKLGPQMEQEGKLVFTESKGQNRIPKHRRLPILPELREAIDAASSGHLSYLVTEFNRPFSIKGLGNRFRKWCDEAGLKHCSAHGLRKAAATIAAENGATEHQLMALFAWDSPKQAALYTRKVNQDRMVDDAIQFIHPKQNMDKSVPPREKIRSSGTKKVKK